LPQIRHATYRSVARFGGNGGGRAISALDHACGSDHEPHRECKYQGGSAALPAAISVPSRAKKETAKVLVGRPQEWSPAGRAHLSLGCLNRSWADVAFRSGHATCNVACRPCDIVCGASFDQETVFEGRCLRAGLKQNGKLDIGERVIGENKLGMYVSIRSARPVRMPQTGCGGVLVGAARRDDPIA
jgi:hypothetical protein